MRLLLAEDDPDLRQTVARGLRRRAFAVDDVADGSAALAQAGVTPYDAMILDVLLPGRDGFAVCQELRRRGNHTPILMLTARDAVEDRVHGLDSGADDYLVKPFEFEELLARLRALLRRRAAMIPDTIVVEDLEVDTRRQEVRRAGIRILLAAREYAFLEYLARHAGEVVSRTRLAENVWDANHDPAANLIDVYASRLRRKVNLPGALPLIHTRRGTGILLGVAPDTIAP